MVQVDKSFAKDIYDKIKSDILGLKIKDGDFLTLAELANKYNVSKTPVRDALGALEIEGYLTSLPRKGYLVKPVTNTNIKECFQMRLIFEKAAVHLVSKTATEAELNTILQLAMNFPDIHKKDNFSDFNSLNDSFHMSIIKATHNSLFTEMFKNIMENLSRILIIDSQHLIYKDEIEEHISIAKALIDRDSKRAEELIYKHISHLENRVYSSQSAI